MKMYVKGNLRGFNCKECSENIRGAIVRLYEPQRGEESLSDTRLNALTPAQVEEKKSRLIAEGPTDENGNFSIEVSEKYQRIAEFDVDFVCGTVPRPPFPPKKGPMTQFHLMQFKPEWEYSENQDSVARVQLQVPHTIWCYIKGKIFDVWTICGTLVNCDTKQPQVGVKVSAMDADLITDDLLGTDITDANGHFTIYYSSSDFRVNFLPFNIETDIDPPYVSSGPDVYFQAHFGTTEILNETSALRRKNVGYCLCVDLCTKSNVPTPGNTNLYSVWTRIGNAFNIPTGPSLNNFDADGFAILEPQKYGLTGGIRLTGQAPHLNSNNNHVQYRFLVSHATTANGGPMPDDASFTKIIGKTPNLLVDNTLVGQLSKVSFPGGTLDVLYQQADFDSEGWLDINKSIERTFTTAGIPVAERPDWQYVDNDTLVKLNTAALTTIADLPFGLVAEGEAIPPASRLPIEKVAIRFEVREFDPITMVTAPLPGSGKTINSMVINNNSIFRKYFVTQLGIGGCSPLSGNITTAYTVHHPLLKSASLRIRNNSGSYNEPLDDSFFTIDGNNDLTVNHGNNPTLQINPSLPATMPRCTYVLELDVQRRLHNGETPTNDAVQQIFFFYQP